MPSVHRDCGADITWLRREDDTDRFLPPMEYAGEVYVKIDGVGVQRHAYRPHHCDPQAIIEWQDYQRRLADAKGEEYTPYDAAREREREQMWELALTVACRRCEMPEDQKCVSQSVQLRKTGEIVECKNPHPQRIEDALAQKDRRE